MFRSIAYLLGLSLTLGGCASIVDGKNQEVAVDLSDNSGHSVPGASCNLKNDKGSWAVSPPGRITVLRSYSDMSVNCRKNGYQPGSTEIASQAKGLVYGNIIFGGIIGAAIDIGTGNAYDYPSQMRVQLGELIDVSEHLDSSISALGGNITEADRNELSAAVSTFRTAGCHLSTLPVRFRQQQGKSHYEGQCGTGRILQAICTPGECRIKTIHDL